MIAYSDRAAADTVGTEDTVGPAEMPAVVAMEVMVVTAAR
jgi:hypothetical protein